MQQQLHRVMEAAASRHEQTCHVPLDCMTILAHIWLPYPRLDGSMLRQHVCSLLRHV